jgi:uncharacterized protein (TIGR01777 family)
MRLVIAGGSGLLGRALSDRLTTHKADVVILTRGRENGSSPARHVHWDPDGSVGDWARALEDADAVVNLTGAGIAERRWTNARKALLRSSRIDSTRSLVSALEQTRNRPHVFVQGSAVGIYGASQSPEVFDEQAPAGRDFLADLAVAWEREALPVAALGVRLVWLRTGIVLTTKGGALPEMARPFRFFAGGRIGSGRQYLSWITLDDWVSLAVWAIETGQVAGAVNATAPEPVTNAEFSVALGRALRRPSWLPAPAMALKLLFGEMADAALLGGQRVRPAVALAHGFVFRHRTINDALASLFARHS